MQITLHCMQSKMTFPRLNFTSLLFLKFISVMSKGKHFQIFTSISPISPQFHGSAHTHWFHMSLRDEEKHWVTKHCHQKSHNLQWLKKLHSTNVIWEAVQWPNGWMNHWTRKHHHKQRKLTLFSALNLDWLMGKLWHAPTHQQFLTKCQTFCAKIVTWCSQIW